MASDGKVVRLVPTADKDPLLGKLDILALQIADGLTVQGGASAPALEEKIAGLKALTSFWQAREKGNTPNEPGSAFAAYRSKIGNAAED